MYSQLTCMVHSNVDVDSVHGRLKRLAITNDPPYDIQSMLAPHISASGGRSLTVRIDHASRDVSVIDNHISHHVLGTAIRAFQGHRLRPRLQENMSFFRQERTPQTPNRNTGKTCSICMENIWTVDLQCLPCAHMFHRNCVSRWLVDNNTCPVCRISLA